MKPSLQVFLAIPALLSFPAIADSGADKLNADTFKALELRNVCPAITPARVADIAVDPRNRSVWYISTAASGVWKTTNRGVTWNPIFDDYGSYSTGCISIDQKNPDVLWLGAGENQALRSVSYGDGIYKSTDAGATWKNVGLKNSEHIGKILIDPRNSDVVYVAAQGPLWAPGGDRGLYKTTDGGQTWKAVLQISENTGITDIAFDPRNADVMYAASYQRRRSVGQLIGGGPEAGIFKTTDAGAHWSKLTNGIPAGDLGRICVGVSPQKPDVVYAAVTAAHRNESGFYRSEDGGATWSMQKQFQMMDPQYYGEMYPDPFKFDSVYIIDSVIAYTPDGGKNIEHVTWATHVDNHALEFDPTDPNHMLVGNDGGLYETYDKGKTWRYFDNMPMQQFYGVAVDNALPFYHIYGGAQDNGSLGGPSRTINRMGIRNSDWVIVGGGDGMQPRADYKDPDIIYTQSQNGALSRMDLKNSSTTGIRPPRPAEGEPAVRFNWNAPLTISPHSPNRLYYAGNRLFRSEDRGTNWKTISPDLTRQLDRDKIPVMGKLWDTNAVTRNTFTTDLGVTTALAESPRKAGLLFVGTDDGLIQVSENDGGDWRKTDTFPGVPDMAMVSDVCPSHSEVDTVYAAFNNYQKGDFKPYLLKSTDQGKTWTSIAANLPENHFVWSIVEDPINKKLLFAGTEFGLFFTIDGGQQWIQLRGGVPTAAFRDLEIQARETDLVCATFGRGFFILDDYSPLRALTTETLAKDAVLFPLRHARVFHELTYTHASAGNHVMPNPPFGATFTYYLKDAPAGDDTRLALGITDADGKQVRQLAVNNTAGLHRITWNLGLEGGAGARRGGEQEEEEYDATASEKEEELEQQAAEAQDAQRGGGDRGERGDRGEEATPARGEGQRRGGGRRGGGGGRGGGPVVLVQPGKYKATLGKIVDGKVVPICDPQIFDVVPLDSPISEVPESR